MDDKIKAVLHIAVIVEDMQRSVIFYRDVLGLQLLKDYTNKGAVADKTLGLKNCSQRIVLFKAGNDNTLVELMQFYSPEGRPNLKNVQENDIGVRHLCFEVDDIRAVYNRLRRAGLKFTSEPVKQATGAICVFFRDPDGNSLEITQAAKK